MTVVDVTIIDPISGEGAKQDLATRLTNVLVARDHTQGKRMRWRVVAQAVPSAAPKCEPDERLASLDYSAWHAHLAGTRRWVPSGINQDSKSAVQ